MGELRQLANAEAEAEEAGKHIAVPRANGANRGQPSGRPKKSDQEIRAK